MSSTQSPNSQLPTSRVVIVCDWLIGGGSERVVEQIHKIFPDAPIYTSYCTKEWRGKLKGKVKTGYLQYWPFSKLRKYVGFLRILWYRRLDLSEFDFIISCTGNGEAKFVRSGANSKLICYCYTPVHYYWRNYEEYLNAPGFGLKPIVRLGLKSLVKPLRKLDYKAAQKVDEFISISSHIQADIKKYYGRNSVVIHPPVDVERFSPPPSSNISHPKRSGFVTVGRQVPFKRFDLAIKTCNELSLPLTVIGKGPEHNYLVSLSGPTVSFVDNASDNEVAKYVQSAKAFIFPSNEDFGIVAVEALAAGTPLIAYESGGALDFVIPSKTGEFFEEQTVESLSEAIKNFKSSDYKPSYLVDFAKRFSIENFRHSFITFLKRIF